MRINIGDKNKFSKTVKELFDLNIPANQFNGISIDSRNIYDGDVFIAMKGENVDSHDFIDSKLEIVILLLYISFILLIEFEFSFKTLSIGIRTLGLIEDKNGIYFINDLSKTC